MKTIFATLLIMTLATTAFAQAEMTFDESDPAAMEMVQRERERGWTCSASGYVATGGPGGGVWQTVWGRGDTQFDAADRAIQQCYSMGLRQCTLGPCTGSNR